jgi:hypothetical protein
MLAAQLAPSAISLIRGLFGGKSPQEKAIERLQQISERGLDPKLLERALGILNVRNEREQRDTLSRLMAGGIDPSSGLAQEAVGATRRSLGARQGEAQALFNQQSEAAKMAATQQLAGLPVDNSTGDLLGSILQGVQAYAGSRKPEGMTFDELSTILKKESLPVTTPEIRGTDFSRNIPQSLPVTSAPRLQLPQPKISPNIGLKQFYDNPIAEVPSLARGGYTDIRRISPLHRRRSLNYPVPTY